MGARRGVGEPAPSPCLYVMVGIPGSGKTTYARHHLPHALRISLDDIRMMLTGRAFDATREPAVAAIGEAALVAALANARAWRADVLFDATNVTRALRRRSLQPAAAYGLTPLAIYLACPLDLALVRNRQRRDPVPDDVVERFHAQLEPPSLGEGFADVIIVGAPAS